MPTRPATVSLSSLSAAATLVGTALVFAGLVLIWVLRASVSGVVYISGLGATGMPTAHGFEVALLLVAAGAALIAAGTRRIGAGVGDPRLSWVRRLLALWVPASTLAVSAACFLVASQFTCTAGCPVPLEDPRAAPQDLVHTAAAVLGFAAACYAMLQVAVLPGSRALARVSLVACVLVGAVTIAGGLISIAGVGVFVGAWLEFAGATVAVGWVVAYGIGAAGLVRRRSPADLPLAAETREPDSLSAAP